MGALDYAPTPPAVPAPEELEPRPADPGLPMTEQFEVRPALGARPFSSADEAITGGWLRFADPQPLDATGLAMYADAWMPSPFPRLARLVPAPTLDLTVHFRAPGAAAALAPDEPVLAVFSSSASADGFFEEDGCSGAATACCSRIRASSRSSWASSMRGYLGLGSNVGDRRANLQAAVDALPGHGALVLACSSTYDTDPVGEILDQPSFLNACVRIETALGPEELLDACKAIEGELGRDLQSTVATRRDPSTSTSCSSGTSTYSSGRLTMPHAEATSRRFVLIPLLELDFELRTPEGTRLSDCLAACRSTRACAARGRPCTCPAVSGPQRLDEPSSTAPTSAVPRPVLGGRHVERGLVGGADQHVRQRADRLGREDPASIAACSAASTRPEAVAQADLAPALPAEHGGAVEEDDALHSGSVPPPATRRADAQRGERVGRPAAASAMRWASSASSCSKTAAKRSRLSGTGGRAHRG